MNPILFLIIAAFAFLGLWLGIPTAFRWKASRDLAIRARAQRAIVLTYDDGPSDVLTLRLADILKRRKVRATFFVIGRNATRHPETIRRMHDDGHEIANHTYNHLNAWKTGAIRSIRDIRKGRCQLRDLSVESAAFRPPFGKSTLLTLIYSVICNTRLAFWTHDSRDSWNRLPVDHILEELHAAGGGVILMHDFDRPRRGPSPEEHQEYVLNLTEKIIDFAETNNFKIIPFRDLFDRPNLKVIEGRI